MDVFWDIVRILVSCRCCVCKRAPLRTGNTDQKFDWTPLLALKFMKLKNRILLLAIST